MTGPDHARFADDAGAYLLGALADDERAAFELHMESCPDCRNQVEQLRPAADALPRSVEQMNPPDRLRASIMDVVRAEGDAAPRPRRERPRLRFSLRPALAGAMLVLGLLVGFGVAQLTGGEDERTITAKVDDARLPTASAELRVEGDGDDGAALTAEGLPDPGPGRVYQAWIARGDKISPAPTFVADRDGSGSVALPEDLSGADAVLVTRERRGGARVPGEMPVMRVDL
ncbi:MAG: anti-sigma factor [Thermoleophilaceae bacterium]|nr:anti-sigma factor [Thermoleophilaceae bacterium]